MFLAVANLVNTAIHDGVPVLRRANTERKVIQIFAGLDSIVDPWDQAQANGIGQLAEWQKRSACGVRHDPEIAADPIRRIVESVDAQYRSAEVFVLFDIVQCVFQHAVDLYKRDSLVQP